MTLAILVDFVNLFFGGILAGMEVAIHYGVRGPSEALGEHAQLQLRQALVLRLRVLVPAFFVPAALSGIAVAVLDGDAPGFALRCSGLGALVIWIAVRVVGTVPINSATLTWQLNDPPHNWQALVNHAERFHMVGVWAVITAFAAFLAAAALRTVTS